MNASESLTSQRSTGEEGCLPWSHAPQTPRPRLTLAFLGFSALGAAAFLGSASFLALGAAAFLGLAAFLTTDLVASLSLKLLLIFTSLPDAANFFSC